VQGLARVPYAFVVAAGAVVAVALGLRAWWRRRKAGPSSTAPTDQNDSADQN